MTVSRPRDSNSADSLIATIVGKIADREGTEPTNLQPPLYDVIDPDALGALFRTDTNARVEFAYGGRRVTVDAGGEVRVEKREQETTAKNTSEGAE